jgi:peroxiredoxin-like protein
MQPFPHHYTIVAQAGTHGDITLEGDRLPSLLSAAPAEFDGPGDRWSPETLLVAAVSDCFILTFRAIAAASKLTWISVACDVTGTVDRVDRVTQFTAMELRARLRVPPGTDQEVAHRLLAKAEQSCLVSNSLKFRPHLDTVVEVEGH